MIQFLFGTPRVANRDSRGWGQGNPGRNKKTWQGLDAMEDSLLTASESVLHEQHVHTKKGEGKVSKPNMKVLRHSGS